MYNTTGRARGAAWHSERNLNSKVPAHSQGQVSCPPHKTQRNRWFADPPLEGNGFEPVWGFFCQVVVFGWLAVLCSEREGRSSSRRLRSGSRSARKGSRDRNASRASG